MASGSAGPRRCPACGAAVGAGLLRCASCDEWLDTPGARPAGVDRTLVTQPFVVEEAPADEAVTLERASGAPRDLESPACPACRSEVGADWRFCKSCGTALQPVGAALPATGIAPLAPVTAPPLEPARHVLTVLVGPGSGERRTHEVGLSALVIGRAEGTLQLPDDTTASSRHAAFEVRGGRCVVTDLGSTNGTFLSIRGDEPLEPGSVVIVGRQRLLYRRAPRRLRGITHELVRVMPGGREGGAMPLGRRPVSIGKAGCTMAFDDDVLVSRRHAEIVPAGDGHAVRDLGSTNRTYVLVRGAREVHDGDRIAIGGCLLEYRRVSLD